MEQRRLLLREYSSFRWVEGSWIAFLVYFALRLYFDVTVSGGSSFSNLQNVLPYTIFFPTIALFSDSSRLKKFILLGFFGSLIGSIIIILQSINGFEPLFDPSWYHLGAWKGNQDLFGSLVRVNLPVGSWIVFCFLFAVSYTFKKRKIYNLFFMCILLIPILITLFRSLWLAIVVSIFFEIIIFSRRPKAALKLVFKIAAVTAVIVYVGIILVNYFGQGDTQTDYLFVRLIRGFADIQNQTGTYGNRILTILKGMRLFQEKPLFGIGFMFYYYGNMPYLVDIGFIYVGVLLGTLGLILVLGFFVTHCIAGIELFNKSIDTKDIILETLPLSLIGYVITLFIYQHWLIPYSTPNIAIITALAYNYSYTQRTAV